MIKGTFIDEISHDIPHQNWDRAEWDRDFAHMKEIGLEFVILIRCGYRKWVTYPSRVLKQEMGVHTPPVDLVALFLELCEKHGLAFYFGLYDSGAFWTSDHFEDEVALNKAVIDEVWEQYGHHQAFQGWYISHEASRGSSQMTELYQTLGHHCKSVSHGLTVLISPYMDGVKNVSQYAGDRTKETGITLEQQKQEWEPIFRGIQGAVDIVAFQDGHVEFEQLEDFMRLNKSLADQYNIQSWVNIESFDRDMPIKFLPIKWEKMLFKLNAAKNVGIHEAITFEFSHFMSPQSMYLSAGHLFNRYHAYWSSQLNSADPSRQDPKRKEDHEEA